jgi:hypothetical protein
MNSILLPTITACLLFYPLDFVHAQRSIGEVKKDTKTAGEDMLDIPVNKWLGKKFIFLEKPKILQEYGYDLHLTKDFYSLRSSYNPELETDVTYNLRYGRFAGKTMTVIDIEDKSFDPVITFEEEQSKIKIYGKPYKGYLDGIAITDDMERAKSRWLRNTLYSKVREIITYSAELDEYGEVKVKIGDSLKVIDVWWGEYSTDPLWIIVEAPSGEKGFISTPFSWTNIYLDRWKESRPWEDKFYEFNPRDKFKWSQEIWSIINDRKIKIGMSKEQVKLSWGRPTKINEDIYQGSVREQWVYESQYLYFENDKLTAMQNR